MISKLGQLALPVQAGYCCNMGYWYVGVFICLVATFAATLGNSFLRISFVQFEKSTEPPPPLYMRKIWLLAMLLIVVINPIGELTVSVRLPPLLLLDDAPHDATPFSRSRYGRRR